MGLRGPQPQPTALKLLNGNPGKRAINKFEPRPNPILKAEPPPKMSAVGQEVWRRIVPILGNVGILTEADLPLVERYCEFLAQWRACRDFMNEHPAGVYGQYDMVTVNGKRQRVLKKIVPYPHAIRMQKLSEHLMKIEAHLGMTPSARCRMLVDTDDPHKVSPPPEDDDDDFA